MSKYNICICGGGNISHALAGILSNKGHSINILKSILTYFQILVNFLVTSRRPLTPILPFYKYFTEERGNRGGGILPFQGGIKV